MNASSEAPEDSALLEQILRESAAGGGGASVHGGATDFGATASETVHGGAAGEGTNMAGVLSGVGARIADLKLGEKLGTLGQRLGTLAEGTGDKVLVTWNPDRVLAETVEVPVGIVGWQLRLPSGWGPYLCLPLQDGTYTRLQLAATVQALLQSTVGSKDGLEWKVMVLARQRRLCFRLISTATPPTTANRVCGFRLAPSGELCEAFGCELGPDGWLTSETDVDGSFCAGHAALGPVTVDKIPARVPAADTSAAVGQCAGLPAAAPGSSVPAAPSGGGGRRSKWRENVRASVGRHLEMATAELSDISNAARQSGASMIKLMQHPIASFGVPLQLVVRREMEVVVSCGGMRQERPPIVLENLLSSLDSLWGAGGAGGGLLLQQQPLSSRRQPSIVDTVLAARRGSVGGVGDGSGDGGEQARVGHGHSHRLSMQEEVVRLLDDSPGAPELARRYLDAGLLWAVLCEYFNSLPEPLMTFAAHARLVDSVAAANGCDRGVETPKCEAEVGSGGGGGGGVVADAHPEAVRGMWGLVQSVTETNPAHVVTARRLFSFLHRHIFLLPLRHGGTDVGGGAEADVAACRQAVLRGVGLGLGLAVTRPSNDPNAAAGAAASACMATCELIQHAPVLFT